MLGEPTVIRTLLAIDGALVRGALSLVLAAEDDISVVAEVDRGDVVTWTIRTRRPDVAVVDLDLVEGLPVAGACPLLVLAEPRRAGSLHTMLTPPGPSASSVATCRRSGWSTGSAGCLAGSRWSTRNWCWRRCTGTAPHPT
ncbi:hypothetical protein GCM10029963_06760 [Micromonospora andamanensis]